SQSVYRPRWPEKTVLFSVVKKHYTTWHKNAENPVPQYIDKEFKSYLGCGILAKGFACARCEDCRQEFLIAFSCKRRGICTFLIADGVFSAVGDDLLFLEAILTPDDIADTHDCIQRRVLKFFKKHGWFDQDT